MGLGVKPHGWHSGRGRSTMGGYWAHEHDELYILSFRQHLLKSAVKRSQREHIDRLTWVVSEGLGAALMMACCIQSSKGGTGKRTNYVMNKRNGASSKESQDRWIGR